MSDHTSPKEHAPAAPEPRRRSSRLALAPLWVASVLVLSLGIGAVAAYLMMREPAVVERVLPPLSQPDLSPEAVRRLEALRSLNAGLAEQVGALRRELEQPPPCPPGTQLGPSDTIRKSALEGAPKHTERLPA